MKLWIFLPLLVYSASAQLVSVGVKAGVPLTDASSTVTVTRGANYFRDNYIIGPTVEVHLPFQLSVEADALYRHSGYSAVNINQTTVNEWQIPVLGKFELPLGLIHPFVDAGVAYRHISLSGNNSSFASGTNLAGTGVFIGVNNPNDAGFVIGGGIGLKLSRFRITPEIRYTHWGQQAFSNAVIISSKSQADFLVGLTF